MIRNRLIGTMAIAFGILTLWSGGIVIFGPDAVRVAAGRVAPFVLWFNFLSGTVYIVAGIGILQGRRFGKMLASALALASTVLFAAFLARMAAGEEWDARTLGALTLRFLFWCLAAWASVTTRPANRRARS